MVWIGVQDFVCCGGVAKRGWVVVLFSVCDRMCMIHYRGEASTLLISTMAHDGCRVVCTVYAILVLVVCGQLCQCVSGVTRKALGGLAQHQTRAPQQGHENVPQHRHQHKPHAQSSAPSSSSAPLSKEKYVNPLYANDMTDMADTMAPASSPCVP